MVKTVTCYEDGKGVLHKDAFAAHAADLAMLLARGGDISEASAVKFVERLKGSKDFAEELVGALSFMEDARPQLETLPNIPPPAGPFPTYVDDAVPA